MSNPLINSFCFLEGIGPKKEENIWNQGITTWSDFISASRVKGISPRRKFYYDQRLREAKKALLDHDSSFFSDFPSTETWRLFGLFCDDAVYIDIETGAKNSLKRSNVSIITLYDGINVKTFVKEINLYKNSLKRELERYKLIITFNGSTFDLPIMKRHFSFTKKVPHIDLRFACEKMGLNGGLKQIERELGMNRSEESSLRENETAAFLWKMWRSTRKKDYLDRFVAYNQEDSVNLEPIAKKVLSELSSQLNEKMNRR